jgi:hypothetical protein
MPAPNDAVLPSRRLASQSGCTYRQLQAIGVGAHATVRFPHARRAARCDGVVCLLADLNTSRRI